MSAESPFGVERMALYFHTAAGAATPAVGNLIREFRGEPTISDVSANAMWRGQNRVAKYVVFHDREVSMSIPGFSFDSSIAMAKLYNGTTTAADTLHGGGGTARSDKLTVNSRPLDGEWLIDGVNTADAKTFQVLAHKAFITSINPTIARTDFSTMDLNLSLLADASDEVWTIYHAL